jgi:hypothetical protein
MIIPEKYELIFMFLAMGLVSPGQGKNRKKASKNCA